MSPAHRSAPPVLSDGVVTLRALRPDDAEDIAAGCQDPLSAEWTTVPTPYSLTDARDWLDRRSHLDWWTQPAWAITMTPSDRWSGTIDLRPDGENGAEVGYLLAPWARGQGHSARALRLACSWGFTSLGLEVIVWRAFVGNEPSRQVALRVGFDIADHVFRSEGAQRGHRRDSWIGTLRPEDLVASARQADLRGRYLGPSLTRRELDVLRALTGGGTNRDVAEALGISENTVKNHVRSILEKLQAKSRADAVVIGLRKGITALPG